MGHLGMYCSLVASFVSLVFSSGMVTLLREEKASCINVYLRFVIYISNTISIAAR